MNIAANPPRMRFEEFLEMSESRGFELIDGILVEKQVGTLSAAVGTRIQVRLGSYCEAKGLGEVFSSDALYRCFPEKPESGRKPDASFIAKEHLPADWQDLGYFHIAPDLAVEVISPNDLADEVRDKREEYLRAGTKLVWIVYPEGREVEVFRADGSVALVGAQQQISGEDVVPGFACLVGDLFPRPHAETSQESPTS